MPTNVIMPQMGESVAEGTVTRWMKKLGERVERDEPLFEISTDKVDAEIPSPAAGVLAKILVKENETVPVNTVVAVIDGGGAAETGAAAPPSEEVKPPGPPARKAVEAKPPEARAQPPLEARAAEGKVRSSPLVRRIAREHQVDLAQVRGTGLGGRVSKKDILSYLSGREAIPAPASRPAEVPSPAAAAPLAVPAIVFTGPSHAVAMTPMRRLIAEHMVTSKRASAHVTTVFEVEMTRVVEMRERAKEEFERRNGLKLTFTPFFVRAAVEAIKQFPIFNASVDATNIIYKRDINIGVAVALETGLIVPVIKRADEKSFLGVARAVQDLADRARSKHLSVEDVQDGTFTLTNPGVFGSLLGTPIISQPQVAILGVGAIEKRPVVRNDAIAIRSMVYLSLSFDHRIIDGAVADQFMARIKSALESWEEPVL
jgi:2-oxoglutarate dehydrogenase E2 component (dihydrolipoamide succinyltransferase)